MRLLDGTRSLSRAPTVHRGSNERPYAGKDRTARDDQCHSFPTPRRMGRRRPHVAKREPDGDTQHCAQACACPAVELQHPDLEGLPLPITIPVRFAAGCRVEAVAQGLGIAPERRYQFALLLGASIQVHPYHSADGQGGPYERFLRSH